MQPRDLFSFSQPPPYVWPPPSVRPPPSPFRLIIDHRTFSFFTYTLTNALVLGKLFFFYVGPTTTLFSQTFESPAKTESVVRGRLRHCSRLGRSPREEVTLSPWRSHPISHLKEGGRSKLLNDKDDRVLNTDMVMICTNWQSELYKRFCRWLTETFPWLH